MNFGSRYASRIAVIGGLISVALLLLSAPVFAQLAGTQWPRLKSDIRGTGQSAAGGPSSVIQKWVFSTGGTIASSPVVGPDGTVYFFSQDHYLYAVNPDGTQKWRFNISSTTSGTPTIASDGTVYIGMDNYIFYAINPNGTKKWQVGLGKAIKASAAIGPDGTVYIGQLNGLLYAITPAGAIKWQYNTAAPILSSAAIGSDGTIYIGSEDAALHAINPANGSRLWRFLMSSWVDASPAIGSDGKIYIASTDGNVYAIAAGVLGWNFNIGGNTKSSPALASDGSVYIGGEDNALHALTPSGVRKWRFATTGKIQSIPAIGANGIIYATSVDNKLYAVNSDGTLQWQFALGGAGNSPAIASDGTLYVTASDGKLYAFARDNTPPTQPIVTDDGVYSTNPTTLHASWSSSDPETGISEYQYAIGTIPGGTDVVDYTSAGTDTQVTRSGLSLTNGVTYYFSVKAKNGAMLISTVGVSDGIKVDSTAPTTPAVTDDGSYTNSVSSLNASWISADPESGIAQFEYAIGTSAQSSNVVPWTPVGTQTGITRTGLALQAGATYYISVRATNNAGLTSATGSSNGITVDPTGPTTPVVTDDGDYSSSSSSLHATWASSDPESGIADYSYAVGTSPGGISIRDFTVVATNEINATGLALQDGVKYYISVKARNNAGQFSAVGSSNGITVDSTPPTTPVVTDDGQFTTSGSTLHASWTASDPHTGIAFYEYAIGTSSGLRDVVDWTNIGSATSVTRSDFGLVTGETYYFYVRATNPAGRVSSSGVSNGIIVDMTPPGIPVVTDDGTFTASPDTLHATWSATDNESGITQYQYAIGTTPGSTNIVGWTSVGTAIGITRSGLSLQDGVTYYFAVKAMNGAGLWGNPGYSNGIVADRTPPSTPVVIDDGAYTTSNSQLHASWSASDPQSGIPEYEYAIGSSPGATNVRTWTSTTNSQVTAVNLPLEDGQTYYFAVKARNGGGQWSAAGLSDGITVDSTAPSMPVVTDDGDYTSVGSSLHASWVSSEPHTAITEYQYAIGTTSGGTNVVNWTSTGLATSVTKSGLSLVDGVVYYISVKATNLSGLVSTVGVSDGIIVDRTGPSTPIVLDDGAFTSSLTALHASWSASDVQSGISDYQYAIGTTPGGTNVVNYTSVGAQTDVTRTGLSLSDGVTYYFSVKAKNGSGLFSGVGVSNGITVDSSGPGKPVVVDDGQYTTSSTTLHASWTASPGVSGITDFQYAIGTTSGGTEIVPWTSVGTALEVTRSGLTLVTGQTYYFAVKALNAVGVTSPIGVSDGITVDRTAPSRPVVVDDGQYTANPDTLHASWSSADAESGIIEYKYAIGSSVGSTDLVGWTSAGAATEITRSGLSLADGATYYFAVQSVNGAGLGSLVGYSDGITVDKTLPTTPVVTDEGEYTASPDTLSANWTSSYSQTGIVEYQYAIGTTPDSTDVVGWTSVGTNTSVTKSGLSLQDGTTYYFRVKSRNGAGQFSLPGVSNGIRADKSPPALPVVTDDGEYTYLSSQLHATWIASEPHSGIAEYQYAIGSAPGAADVVGWTSTGTTPFITRSGLSLSAGVTYYFSVKARNLLNMWSAVGSSDGIRVDTSPPSVPVVTDEGDTTASGDSLSATFIASDPEGGIAEYQYAIGTTAGGMDVVPFSSAGAFTQVTRTGLTLNPGATYYFAVKARNKAGLWSGVGVSDGIIYVSSVTWPKFRGDTRNTGVSQMTGSQYGALLWEYTINGWVDSSPAIAGDGTIYYGAGDGALYALTKNGVLKWKYQTQGPIDSSVAIDKNGNLFFGSYDGNLYSTTPSGISRWQFPVPDAIWSSPVIGPDDVIYFGCQNGSFYAVNANGTQKWKFDTGGAVWSSAALSNDGVLYFGSGDGFIYAVYAATGTQKWRFFTGSAVDSSPAIAADGTIYAGSGDGYFYALNPNGSLKWRYSIEYPPDCSAAIGPDNTIYVGYGNDWSTGKFIAFRPDGSVKWQFDAHGMVRSSPVLSPDGILYFGSGDGNIYAVDTNGVMRWKYKSDYAILSSPVISNDGSVIVASYNGQILAFKDSNIDDSTPPTTPSVIDQGAATTSLTTLSATWSADDPESGVSDYKYAIGTWPGTDDVVPWTAVGSATSVTRSDLNLTVGVIYYFSVIARNQARIWSSTGYSDGIAVVLPGASQSVGQAKQAADGLSIYLTSKVVTAVFSDCFYAQESNRSAAIKVIPVTGVMPEEGDTVSFVGSLIMDNGERAVRMTTMLVQQHGSTPTPISMLVRDLGGSAPAQNIPGVTGGKGLNTIGLLAEVLGRVTSVSGDSWVLDDGSPSVDPIGSSGVRVKIHGLRSGQAIAMPSVGDFLRVTGIVSMEPVGAGYRRVLRPRGQADIEKQ